MFLFTNFVQKVNFKRSQFGKMGVALSKFLWFVLGSFRVLGESCFKAPKAPLDEYFYHWNDYFCYFCIFVQKIGFEQSKYTFSAFMFLFFFFDVGIRGKYFIWWNICENMKDSCFFEYFESLESFELNIELEVICPTLRKFTWLK